ncbi:uncharacterized protein [Aegilops tauschii subsp. strangulata]|uniref:uncharacterized protein n=1 Tax=Aegilops tauschii subsp. strangulata TaxID=200361 RepID=UPI003CC8D257
MQQKLLLALLLASRKLRHYFHGHLVKVISAYPLEQVLRSLNAAGRVAEWNIELQAFQLEYCTTRVIKGAALTDFMEEWVDRYKEEPRKNQSLLPGDEVTCGWVLYFDGTFSRQGAGAGVSNNITEYEGLIAGLKAASTLGIKRLTIKGDSQLLVNFSNKKYKPKDEHMAAYLEEVCKLEKRFLGLELQHIPRGVNMEADGIIKQASYRELGAQASSKKQATAYCLKEGELYSRRPNGISLQCISEEQGRELLATFMGEIAGTTPHCAPSSASGYSYLCVAIDKFTKWAEVEPVRAIPAGSAVKFIRGLVTQFGIPNRIIIDNGSQFTSGLFKSYYASIGTQICYASVAHPRSNGQAECANAEVHKGLKSRSSKKKLEAYGKGCCRCNKPWVHCPDRAQA